MHPFSSEPSQPDTATDSTSGSSTPDVQETQREAHTIYRHASTVTLFTTISRIMGMLRDLSIAHRFGTDGVTDAWVQAFRIPNLFRQITAEGSLNVAFVPIFVQLREQEGLQTAFRFAQQVLGVMLWVSIAFTVVGILFSEPLTALFSPGFLDHPDRFALAARLLRWFFPYLVLVSVVAWAMGVLNAQGSFAAPAAAPILFNLSIIVALFWTDALPDPVLAIVIGVLAGSVLQVLLQVPALTLLKIPFQPRLGWKDVHLRRFFKLFPPFLIGVGVQHINLLLLSIIASYLPTGQIFHLYNAQRLYELVMGLFAFAFISASLPELNRHMVRQDWGAVRQTLRLTLAAVLFIVLPAMAGLIVTAPAVVAMLYQHGAFGQADALSTAAALRMLAIGMPVNAALRVILPMFYAMGNPRTPVLAAGGSMVITVISGWLLSRSWEVQGLAAAIGLGIFFQYALLSILLKRKAPQLGAWFPWRAILIQGLAALVAAFVAHQLVQLGDWSQGPFAPSNWMVLANAILCAMTAYLGITWGLGDAQAQHWLWVASRVVAKLGRR